MVTPTRAAEAWGGNTPYQSPPIVLPSGKSDMAVAWANASATLGAIEIIPGVRAWNARTPNSSENIAVVISATAERAPAYSPIAASIFWSETFGSGARAPRRDVPGPCDTVGRRPDDRSLSPATRGSARSCEATSASILSATEVRSRIRRLASQSPEWRRPRRRNARAAIRVSTSTGANATFRGARSKSQPNAAPCSRNVPRQVKCRSTNPSILARQPSKYSLADEVLASPAADADPYEGTMAVTFKLPSVYPGGKAHGLIQATKLRTDRSPISRLAAPCAQGHQSRTALEVPL